MEGGVRLFRTCTIRASTAGSLPLHFCNSLSTVRTKNSVRVTLTRARQGRMDKARLATGMQHTAAIRAPGTWPLWVIAHSATTAAAPEPPDRLVLRGRRAAGGLAGAEPRECSAWPSCELSSSESRGMSAASTAAADGFFARDDRLRLLSSAESNMFSSAHSGIQSHDVSALRYILDGRKAA